MHLNQDKLDELKKIEVVLMDMDGCLTNGNIIYTSAGDEIKIFHTHDGYGITRARSLGIKFAIISGRGSPVNKMRVDRLGIEHLYEHVEDKRVPFEELKKLYNLPNEAFAFIGDDEFDIPLLQQVGFSSCPQSAIEIVKDHVDLVCNKNGGEGCVREIIDIILRAKGLIPPIVKLPS